MQAGSCVQRAADAPARKLVIKPLKTRPKLPENFEHDTWARLQAAITAVHTKQPVGHSLEELYRAVEDMCVHNLAASIYDRLRGECELHIESRLEKLLGQTPDTLAFLSLVHSCWADHCEQMLTLRSIFLYLDRTYVMQVATKKSLWDMGLQIFRAHLSRRQEIVRKSVQGLLALIEAERSGDQVERMLLHSLLRMFHDLGMYVELFELPFLRTTREFYAAEAAAHLQAMDVPTFLQHVQTRLTQEEQRVQHYLHMSTRKALLQTALQTLLATAHVDTLLEKGFTSLMEQSRHEDLRSMYTLLALVDALPRLRQAFAAYIKRVGTAMVGDAERERTLVQDLLQFKEKLDRILSDSFSSNEQFGHSLKEAFESFINVRQNRSAELVARFIDAKLRSGNKGTSEEELEEVLDKTMTLFRYIDGKDMFEAFYKKDLSKRLLLDKSASVDAEKSMISKLKAECGSGFTSKLEGMFKDVDLSRDVMTSFKESPQARDIESDVELSVHVLTQGYWPTYPPVEVKLPREVLRLQEIFNTYYTAKHNGRRLQWHPCLGHCTLKATFPSGRKELVVSLLQAIVLLLFNDGEQFSYSDILAATGIEDKELKVTLQSLACAKQRVLRKEPKGRDVADDDVFFFDADFKHPLFRIKVNSIQMRENEQENEQTTERVFQDRQYQIDAAIVRIMKARKTLTHSLLISELYQQLKFPLKPPDLKKRIESLIDREYLERDASSSSVYRYLA